MGRRIPWWAAIGAFAFLLRLGYVILADEPLLFRHQYHYFRGGMLIAENADPWSYVLHSDEWRMWDGMWTLAPGYFWFLAVLFRVGGMHLLTVRVAQCVLEAGTAALVAVLARRVSTPRLGLLAGLAYALYWPSVVLPGSTMTENLHTFLLTAAFVAMTGLVLHDEDGPRVELLRGVAVGLLFGVAGLARTVGTAFLALALPWIALEPPGGGAGAPRWASWRESAWSSAPGWPATGG